MLEYFEFNFTRRVCKFSLVSSFLYSVTKFPLPLKIPLLCTFATQCALLSSSLLSSSLLVQDLLWAACLCSSPTLATLPSRQAEYALASSSPPPQVWHYWAPLPLWPLPPPGQTLHPQSAVCQYLQQGMEILATLLKGPHHKALQPAILPYWSLLSGSYINAVRSWLIFWYKMHFWESFLI